jgi:FixJ family two-component response regulator
MPERPSFVVSVVDDDPSLRRSLRNLLSSTGYTVETFESAESFLASADTRAVGCLVLDLRMPGMSGTELLNRLTASGSHLRVIILTAHGDEGTRRRSLQAGAAAFLEKPFDSAALFDAITSAMSTPASGA